LNIMDLKYIVKSVTEMRRKSIKQKVVKSKQTLDINKNHI
jgi:hypothetical protein